MAEGTVETSPNARRIIERPRLTRLLDESPARIKMLIAPAGYGKTTLARQWLGGEGRRCAWYRATPASGDLAALADGVSCAITFLHGDVGGALRERLAVTRSPQLEADVFGQILASELNDWSARDWLVIDDYQEIRSPHGDTFVAALLESPINLMVLSRERPSWATARLLLYGEVLEVGIEQLEMTLDEGIEILGADEAAFHVIREARGWPAVIGLASSSPILSQNPVQDLHRFFAEELYRATDQLTRDGISELAAIGVTSRGDIDELLGHSNASHVIGNGIRIGLLTLEDERVSVHPLLRAFLIDKLRADPDRLREIGIKGFEYLANRKRWDAVCDLVELLEMGDLVPELLALSATDLLDLGRTETLRRLIELHGVDVAEPAVRLASAELAYREGQFHASAVLAELAGNAEGVPSDIQARAYLLAGRAAHAASREHEALKFFHAAKTVSNDASLRRAAALGELAAAFDLEMPNAPALADELASYELEDMGDRLILADRRLTLQTRFALPLDLDSARAASQLLGYVTNPIARMSFRNVFGYVLAACGHLDEATSVAEEQLQDAERHRLSFVVPYTLAIQAMCSAGKRSFQDAEELAETAVLHASASGDRTAAVIAESVLVRVLIAQGRAADAVAVVPPIEGPTPSLRAELHASLAIARAMIGDTGAARRLCDVAESESGAVEAAICVPLARAIAALEDGDDAGGLEFARIAVSHCLRTGVIEQLVAAYRGYPRLVTVLLLDEEAREAMLEVLSRSGDPVPAHLGAATRRDKSAASLSPREREVLQLLGRGMSNREIAKTLFISLPTVKVHVRHIFEKLNVDSRTAAALRANQIERS